jgi:DEAD/DEAH box helicase domain-containing protein
MSSGDILVYDIETKDTFQQVGSRDARKLHISVIGMYSYNEDAYICYTEDELSKFFRRLETASLVVGFTNKHFDDIVVSAYFPEMSKIPSFDILERVQASLGYRVKLDSIAEGTLGYGKSGDGLKAVRLYADGKIDELCQYCLDDVKITKEVYEFGKQYGFLKHVDLRGVKEFSVDFSTEEPAAEVPLNLSLF